ncbi:hypothetical protein [Micromonospora sp. NPDC049204]|uniref:hypothetical protein n=1 Tax=Micromonospora sp. NPDC049204 TaxID=3154351 RepID=UPI00340BD3D0
MTALDLPVRLESNGAVAGWLTFELPAGLFPDGSGIQRYDTVLQDSRGIAVTVSASVLPEVEDDQTSDGQEADETSGRSR